MKLQKTLPALFILASASLFAQEMQPDEVVAVVNNGTIKPFDELHQNLLTAFPDARIKDAKMLSVDGGYHYQLRIRDQQQQVQRVLIDAVSGQVLGVSQDA
ncbi:PepSY domain-containing protein [Gallaecimonas mangrovi]|uniref:PepSY domain-containing protein n=1 Tax=Gallaecimonas mangrovi TaxID=2291597 RepID=UPI000E2004C2|nr:hypothetical protein [Gallaecimonas mangrovi]